MDSQVVRNRAIRHAWWLSFALLLGCVSESTPPYDFTNGNSSQGDGDGDGDDGDGDNAGRGDGDNGDGDGDTAGNGDGDDDGDDDLDAGGDGDGDESDDAGADSGTDKPGTKSAGCGKADAPESGTYQIDVDGTEREYIIKLPSGYDADKPYKLIFTWHYLDGSASGIARNYYGLEARSGGSAIFVSPQGLSSGGTSGWPNTGGRDVAFAKAMVDKFKQDYCIDNDRVFSTGFSYGAIMSNTVGCAMGDVFRAIAPMAGSGPRGSCVGQVAVWLYHGSADRTVSFSSGERSRDHWLEANHCDTTQKPVDPSPCVQYDGCDSGHPVVWCEDGAGHRQPSFGAEAIWEFFSQF